MCSLKCAQHSSTLALEEQFLITVDIGCMQYQFVLRLLKALV